MEMNMGRLRHISRSGEMLFDAGGFYTLHFFGATGADQALTSEEVVAWYKSLDLDD